MNKSVEYRGRVFSQQAGQPYYRAWNLEKGRPDYLHRVVWEDVNGPIPEGFDVHHLDEDPENNEAYNLEALSRQDHRILHWESLKEDEKESVRANLIENAVPAAAQWHRSVEGRKWHSDKAKLEIPNRVHELACEQCGREVQRVGVIQKGRFCSNACKSAHRRASGADDVEQKCPVCGGAFKINKYRKAETCGRTCRNKLMWQRRR